MEELINALEDSTNIRSITYQTTMKKWIVEYKNGLKPSVVATEILIDFIEHA